MILYHILQKSVDLLCCKMQPYQLLLWCSNRIIYQKNFVNKVEVCQQWGHKLVFCCPWYILGKGDKMDRVFQRQGYSSEFHEGLGPSWIPSDNHKSKIINIARIISHMKEYKSVLLSLHKTPTLCIMYVIQIIFPEMILKLLVNFPTHGFNLWLKTKFVLHLKVLSY